MNRLVTLMGLAVMFGCGDGTPSLTTDAGLECKFDYECASGFLCKGNVCVTPDNNGFDANFVGCVNDTDCFENGTGCGSEVCSWADPLVHKCVPAGTDPGWCGDYNLVQEPANRTCKCHAQGATCNTDTNFCSFTHL